MKKPFATPQRRQHEPATARRASPYHYAAIRYDSNQARVMMQQFALQTNLSNQAPPFLETQRFWSNEAPLLPLAGCAEEYCQCRYVHYEDRRERDRRHAYGQSVASTPAFVGRERRSGTHCRRLYSTTNPPAARPPRARPGR
jgi:hypothetical protein